MQKANETLSASLTTSDNFLKKIRLLESVSTKLVSMRFSEITQKKAKENNPPDPDLDSFDEKRVQKLLERIAFANSLRTAANVAAGLLMVDQQYRSDELIENLIVSIGEVLEKFAVPELIDNDYEDHLTNHHKNILGMAQYAHLNIFAIEQ